MTNLVLLRHGESNWNRENRFTGWVDVDLSPDGEEEARHAGELFLEQSGFTIDVAHTSLLTRAVRTAEIALAAASRSFIPVHRSWRLNERHYGALTGLNKKETAERYGDAQVHLWRRGYDTPPDPVALDDDRHPIHDQRYALVPRRSLPATECLADVVRRVVPYFEDAIAPELLSGKTVLIAAHGNSLRALWKYLEHVSDDAIADIEFPTGIPRVYDLDAHLDVRSADFLGDPEVARLAAAAVAAQAGRAAN